MNGIRLDAGWAPELAGHYCHPQLLALAHTVALGWITLTIHSPSS